MECGVGLPCVLDGGVQPTTVGTFFSMRSISSAVIGRPFIGVIREAVFARCSFGNFGHVCSIFWTTAKLSAAFTYPM